MNRTRSLVAATAIVLSAAAIFPSPAGAADGDGGSSTLTATITAGSVGSRSVTSVPAIAMTSALDSATLSGTYSAVVTEAARTGTNPWSITGSMAGALSDGATPTPNTVPLSALAISGRDVVQVASGGTSAAATGSAALTSAVTLFSNTGQSTSAVYTGTHTASGTITLTPPNGTVAGVYTGTFTVTLVQ